MSILTREKCLVLNKGWTPVGTVTLRRGLIMVFSTYEDGEPKARIIDHTTFQAMTWEDWAKLQPLATDARIASANMFFKAPEVIQLTRYDKLPQPKVHFNRQTLYNRDKKCCMYCGKQTARDEWSVDHVIPRAHGGLTTWENCVVSCVDCNRRKADKTLKQAGMTLRKKPEKPRAFVRFTSPRRIESWSQFLGEAYFNVELENDNEE